MSLFTVIAKLDKVRFVKYHCNDLIKFEKFIIEKFGKYHFITVYNKRTREKLECFHSRNPVKRIYLPK